MLTSTTGSGIESCIRLLVAGISGCTDLLSPRFASFVLLLRIVLAGLALASGLIELIVAFLLARGRAAVDGDVVTLAARFKGLP